MKNYFQSIIRSEKQVDGIFIPGDLLFYLTKYPDVNYFKALNYDFLNLANQMGAPIFVSYGNHDLPLNEDKDFDKKKGDLKYNLEDVKNGIYVLDNEQVVVNDVLVTGFSPKRDAYNTNYMPDKALEMAYQEFQNCHFTFDQEHCNILLSHENKFFAYPQIASNYGELYSFLTLIVGGHLHDGYVPIRFQKSFSKSLKDLGIWEKIPPVIDMCRGLFKVSEDATSKVILPNESGKVGVFLKENESASIVNRGVAKYSWFLPGSPGYTVTEVEPFLSDSQIRRREKN
jgi:hypothetical protein